MKNISVFGLGYVGTSLAIMLSKFHDVTAIDIDTTKVDKINSQKSPISDSKIEKYIKNNDLNIKATTGENMGFVGRGEGIACYATVLIEKT